MAVRVALVNNKGGSGKTALTINLASALADDGLRVLVADLDPQANATRRLGRRFDPQAPTPTLSEAIKSAERGVAADVMVPCAWDGYAERIDVLPSRFDLENRISEAAIVGATSRLRRALEGVDAEHDVTLIDCPPSLGHLTQLAFTAADAVLCVLEPEYDGVEGAVRVRDFLTEQAEELHVPNLRLIGYVVNRERAGLGAHAYQVEGLPDLFGSLLWEPRIPERAAIKDAGDAAVPLRSIGTGSARETAELFADLAKRLRQAVGV